MLSDFSELIQSLIRHRKLLLALTRDELLRPFVGSAMGLFWVVFHPLALMLLYFVVFAVVFRVRLGAAVPADYAVYLVAGLVSWMAWARVLTASCQSVVGNANLVKEARFPAEVLPARTVLVSLIPQFVGIGVILLYSLIRLGTISWTFALLPIAVLVQAFAMLGVAYLLAATCVFVRDVKEIATVFVVMGIYLVPAFYTPAMLEQVHPLLRAVLEGNPFTLFMNVYRDCLVWGDLRHAGSWGVTAGLAIVLSGLSYRIFHRLRMFFGNFL